MMSPIRVLLVEDNEAYRDSLRFLLGRREGIDVVGAVSTGEEAAAAAEELEADVAVVDLRLPGIGGAETAEAVGTRHSLTRVVFLSASAGAAEQDAARSIGVGLVQKDEGIEALARAIRAAHAAR
jgi:two-component system, NarL family, invasion response regulator UvrY